MKVAFSVFGGEGWTGGINYLRNLLSATADLPGKPIQPVLFVAPETPAASIRMLLPYLTKPPVEVPGWGGRTACRIRRLVGSTILQRDLVSETAFRHEEIDVVFQHAAWYGMGFPLPTLAWIADFQHRHLPQMFSRANVLKRDMGYWALSHSATRIMVSSRDALRDCETFFPAARGRASVLPFCVQLAESSLGHDPEEVRRTYDLPARYFYLPNQLWKHKNHLGLLQALKATKNRGQELVIVATGNPSDVRNPAYPAEVLDTVRRLALEDNFRFLGLVPYEHVMPLMRGSLAVVNPSLFEGWSTTVEEAKAIGMPLLLSDIGVHREQAADTAQFFDPTDTQAMANCLQVAWAELSHVQRSNAEVSAITAYRNKRAEFASNFLSILEHTLATDLGGLR